MCPSDLSLTLQAEHSPSFGFLSPPSDTGDASSDDGDHDTLQTPLTDHDDPQHHPYDVYQQHQHHLAQHIFHPYEATQQINPLVGESKTELHSTAYSLSPLSPFLAPPTSGQFPNTQHVNYFPPFSSPSHALDLANASLDISDFSGYNNHTHFLDPGASPFTPTKLSFDGVPSVFASSSGSDSSDPTQLHLASLPSLSVESFDGMNELDTPPLLLSPLHMPESPQFDDSFATRGRSYSPRFSSEHMLNPYFVRSYVLGDELGAGGYGFVMTARRRDEGREVAVKFVIKDKVPEHAWWQDDLLGRIPTEVMLLSLVDHENIVRCLDLYEDDVYFYLVQELHGTPWVSRKKKSKQLTAPGKLVVPTPSSTPSLTPSPSFESTIDSAPHTPPQPCPEYPDTVCMDFQPQVAAIEQDAMCIHNLNKPLPEIPHVDPKAQPQIFLQPPSAPPVRPNFSRRPSHDLFECIEQSKHKRLSENQARYIFAQVVEAVYYLDSQGITHCDIKDENLVVDNDLKVSLIRVDFLPRSLTKTYAQVKLIDFGSAVVADPSTPRPYHTLFFGTTAYASSEILLKQPYRAPPAEIWTLGVLLSYLLTGHSPFPTEQDAIDGRIILRESKGAGRLSRAPLALMGRCLEKDPERRADITEVRGHRWLQGALERGMSD
ncbi:kinase-like domain-containing protein [Amylocystis lapponica]|nr:kinase-like domain-containing protein [Amylocystis lapponica]